MKNNILRHFAMNDLKNHKKDSWFMIVTIFIVTIVAMVTSVLTPLFLNKSYIEHLQEVGTWEYESYEYVTPKQIENMEVTMNNQKVSIHDQQFLKCVEYLSGYTFNSERMSELKGDYSITATNLIEGRMPQNKNEVALKKAVLDNWGLPEKIGQTISLVYKDENNKAQVNQFQVVGFIDKTGLTDIVVKDLPVKECKVYLKGVESPLVINDENFRSNTSIDEIGMSVEGRNITLVLIELVIMCISIGLINGITFSSFENRIKDYTLLRSIGATRRQNYYIVFLETMVLSLCAMIPATLIVYIGSVVLSRFITTAVPVMLTLDNILFNSFLILMSAIISYFLPAKKALRKSLNGDFGEDDFKYFYYRYKKLHCMRPLYLGWRQLISIKKKMFTKVALISVMTIFTMTVITENVKLYTVQHNLAENLDIYFSFDEREEENIKIQPKDFEWLKDTQVQYSFYQLTHDFFDFNSKVHLEMPDIEEQIDDQSWLSVEGSTIYCLNDDIKQQFQITDLKPGQVVLTSAYVNRCSIQENEITYGKETYNIHQIVPSDTKDMIIMCKEDYQKFGNLNEYQEVIIRFDNIQQKNQFLLSYPQEICDLSNRYSLTKHYVNMLYDNDEPLLANYTIERILLIAMMAVIYIYQFGFELLKQRENIGTYQLLGLTKNEIWSIYFYKALMVVGIGMTIGTVYHLLDYYYMTRSLSSFAIVFAPTTLLLNFVITLVLFICILVVSLLPMFSITKRFGLENKNIRE